MARAFRVLGPLELLGDGHTVDLGGHKTRKLLAALVLNRNNTMSADILIDVLWGESPPATARKSLQKFVWALRKHLEGSLVTRGSGYQLEIDDDEVDAARLERAVGESRAGSPGWDHAMEEALHTWRGEPYPELRDTDWGPPEVSRLVEVRLEGEERLIESWIYNHDHQRAVARLDELTQLYPFREGLWALLMRSLYSSGRQAEALDAFQRLRSILGDELGIEPSSELRALEEQILLQDPALKPAGPASGPNNLPAPVTSFVGREDEIVQVTEMLTRARLVTLLGPAGCGKTRLANELGRSLLSDFADDGVWFVDLAPVSSPDQVIDAVAGTLDVGQFADIATHKVVADYLANRRTLLIIDNCEHLVGGVAEVTEQLLRASGELRVLATSRERLGIDGETILDVPPLAYPAASEEVSDEFDAVRLFVERARRVSNDDEVTTHDEEVGEIVRRLDGIPLALELAAARVRTLGLSGLRSRLDDRFSILTSPSRGRLQRHQTLEAALDWSYRLLNEPEQILFARLSVFSGGFDLDSAGEVCGFEPLDRASAVDLIAELVDKSLVSIAGGGRRRRYQLLESLRDYGWALLEPSEATRLRQAHVEHFRDLAEQAASHLHGPGQTEWLASLRLDHDNMRKALRWGFDSSPEDGVRLAVALGGYWDSMGPRTEGNHWLARAVGASEGMEALFHIEALIQAASVASSMHASVPIGYAERAVKAAEETGDAMREGRALRALSWALAIDEQPEAALEAGGRALEILTRHDDRWEIALCQERIGQASYRDPQWSVRLLEEALGTYQEMGDRSREALVLHKIADRLAHSLGDLGTALDYAQRSVAICQEIGSTHDGGHARLEYGKVLKRAGDLERAITELRAALAETSRSGDERCSVRSLTALGNTLVEAGNSRDGESTLREALERGRVIGEIHTTRTALAGLARLYADTGHARQATILLGHVEALGLTLDIPESDRGIEKSEAKRTDLRQAAGRDFDILWERGRLMSLDEAVSLALTASSAE